MRLPIIFAILFFSTYLVSGQISNQGFIPDWFMEEFENSSFSNDYEIMANLKPFFFSDDFDGKGENDVVVLVMNTSSKKAGLLFLLKENSRFILIGAGQKFESIGDDFFWADEWSITPAGPSYETTFKPDGDILGEREIELINPAISLRHFEGSGGVVYFNGENFTWIHQGD